MKKSKLILLTVFLLLIATTLCGCSDEKEDKLDSKISSQIEYLDRQIIGTINKLNNITLENYEVKSKEMSSQTSGGDKSSSEQNSSNGGSSSEGGESSGEGGSSSEGGESSNSNQSSIKVLQMQPSNILVIDKNNIDWMTLKSEIEVMYTSWDSILLDLYSKNINNEDILNFGKTLDDTILTVKSEDKANTLIALANLYSYLPKFADELSINQNEKNLLQTKAHLINAYALLEQDNWTEVQNQLNQADEAYSKIINDVQYIEKEQEKASIVYVSIKELKNSIKTQDKDIFYIKYKNIMNNIMEF